MSGEQQKNKASIRTLKPGDEANLVDFLNFCYRGAWGDMKWWQWLYPQSPSFNKSHTFIIESDNKIVGYRGLYFRELIIQGKKVPVVFLGDTATHPGYRGLGLYSKIHQATLRAAKFEGASIALTENGRGSITYNHNRKTGFIEVKRNHTYVKLINCERVLKTELLTFINNRNSKLKYLLQGLRTTLYLRFGEAEFSLEELLGGDTSKLPVDIKQGKVRIILSEKSAATLLEFLVGGKFHRVKCLLSLFVIWRMRIRFNSPIALWHVILAGIRMWRYVKLTNT